MVSIMYYSPSRARAGQFDHLNANCSSNKAEFQTKLSTQMIALISRYSNVAKLPSVHTHKV